MSNLTDKAVLLGSSLKCDVSHCLINEKIWLKVYSSALNCVCVCVCVCACVCVCVSFVTMCSFLYHVDISI